MAEARSKKIDAPLARALFYGLRGLTLEAIQESRDRKMNRGDQIDYFK